MKISPYTFVSVIFIIQMKLKFCSHIAYISFSKFLLLLLVLWLTPKTNIAQLVLSGDVVVTMETTGSPIFLVIDNPNQNAIVEVGSGGHILSENENAIIRWNTGGIVSNGFTIPFSNGSNDKIHLTFNVNNPSIGQGSIDFSTYPTSPNNLPLPSGVSILQNTANGNINDGDDMYNRYWKIAPIGYSVNPTLEFNFGYTSSEQTNGLTHGITEMQAQFYDIQNNVWTGLFGTDNLNTEVAGVVTSNNLADTRFWTLVKRPNLTSTDTIIACDSYT